MFYQTQNLNTIPSPYVLGKMGNHEPNMRKEFGKVLHDEKRGTFYIYRRVRRDSLGFPIIAPSSLTNRSAEATFGTNKGMKYLFDDYMVIGYKSEGSSFHEPGKVKEYGDSRTDALVLFIEYDALFRHTGSKKDLPDEFDKIIVPELDIDGNLTSPLRITTKYDIGAVEPYRLDTFGKVEFYKINLLSNFDNSIQL
jgi:hypothetical protein